MEKHQAWVRRPGTQSEMLGQTRMRGRGGSVVRMHFAVSLHPLGFAGGLALWEPSWDLCSSRCCPHGAIPRFPTLPSHSSVSPIPPLLSSVSMTQVFRVIVLNWLNNRHLYVHTALQFTNTFIFTFISLEYSDTPRSCHRSIETGMPKQLRLHQRGESGHLRSHG